MKIPAGVKDGARIKLAGRGEPGPAGGKPGDLFVRVRVGADAIFGRKGDNLTLTLPVSFAEAALGANVQVPTLNGPVTLKVPAGTPSGKTFRIKGKGAPKKGGHGDLLATVEVDVPSKLTREQKRLLQELRGRAERLAAGGTGCGVSGMDEMGKERDPIERTEGSAQRAVYIISVAAELAGVHPQTLRIYERKGLVRPQRTSGNTRRYSEADIARLRAIQELTDEGINLAGVKRIMAMRAEIDQLHRDVDALREQLERRRAIAMPGRRGDELVPMRTVLPPPWHLGGR